VARQVPGSHAPIHINELFDTPTLRGRFVAILKKPFNGTHVFLHRPYHLHPPFQEDAFPRMRLAVARLRDPAGSSQPQRVAGRLSTLSTSGSRSTPMPVR